MRAIIPRLGDDPDSPFPELDKLGHTEGLIAWGGDLHPTRLLNAYRRGIFPWFEPRGPILWWSPDPRPVIVPGRMRISHRLRRALQQGEFGITLDESFPEVVAACAEPRGDGHGTWITEAMRAAYTELHRMGHAHSLEVWHSVEPSGTDLQRRREGAGDFAAGKEIRTWSRRTSRQDSAPRHSGPEGPPAWELTGGIYGVAIGKIFFAESKFYRRSNASKIALAVLQRCLEQWGFLALDCQVWNPHLERLGARLTSRADFVELLRNGVDQPDRVSSWRGRMDDADLEKW